MLSITLSPTPIEFSNFELQTDADEREEVTPVIEVRRANGPDSSFDLFAEARQIYVRARMGGRVRASTII